MSDNVMSSMEAGRNTEKSLTFATYNIQCESAKGFIKIPALARYAKSNNISLMGLSSTKLPSWCNGSYDNIEGCKVFISGIGKTAKDSSAGVAFIIPDEKINFWNVNSYEPADHRIIRIKSVLPEMHFIMVYAPTNCKDGVYECFMEDLTDTITNPERTIVMGDFNAWVGFGDGRSVVGPICERLVNNRTGEQRGVNKSGRLLIKFCEEKGFVIANTHRCAQEGESSYTFSSASNGAKTCIDFFLIPEKMLKILGWQTEIVDNTIIKTDHRMLLLKFDLHSLCSAVPSKSDERPPHGNHRSDDDADEPRRTKRLRRPGN